MIILIYNIFKYIFYPIVIGIVSTVMYVLVFDHIFKKILIPWYFSRKYKSTLIDGKWEGSNPSFKFEINIKQMGDKVSGIIIANSLIKTKNNDNKNEKFEIIDSNKYKFYGEIKDGFVRIIHQEKDRNSFGFGCFIFQIAGGGKILNGSVVFVDESDNGYSVSTSSGIRLNKIF